MPVKERTYSCSNYHPELSVRGYEYQFNTETHRNYLSKHRSSDVQSAEYSASQNSTRRRKTAKEYESTKLEKMFWNRT
jgi:hypothetical protein